MSASAVAALLTGSDGPGTVVGARGAGAGIFVAAMEAAEIVGVCGAAVVGRVTTESEVDASAPRRVGLSGAGTVAAVA